MPAGARGSATTTLGLLLFIRDEVWWGGAASTRQGSATALGVNLGI
jgi:hypothetical protein